eukprot:bmy_02693T0
MAFVVMLAAHVIRMNTSFFGCLLVTSDLNCRSLCSLCAPSSSCQHSPLDSEVSQLGDVHRPRKLDLHSLPPMPLSLITSCFPLQSLIRTNTVSPSSISLLQCNLVKLLQVYSELK